MDSHKALVISVIQKRLEKVAQILIEIERKLKLVEDRLKPIANKEGD